MFSRIKNNKSMLVYIIACIAFLHLPLNSRAVGDDPAMEKYYSANALYNKKLYKLAVDEYKNFMIHYPNHPKYLNAKLGVGLSYYEMGDYKNAAPVFQELSENRSAPHQEEIHNLLGQCMLIFNDPVKAEAAFRWSVNRGRERFFLDLPGVGSKYQESPNISMATIQDLEPLERSLAGLIEALYQQRKNTEVIRVSNDLIKLVPQGKYTLRAKLLSALANYELKNYQAAATILEELIKEKNSPYLEHAYFLLAECQHQLNDLNKAEKNYTTVAKELKGKLTDNALFRLGFIKFQQKKYQSAINDFSDLRAIYAKSEFAPQAGIYLGRCFLELKNYPNAQSIFGSLSNDPAVNAEAALWLARTFARQKKHAEAAEVLKPAVARFTRNPLLPNILFDYGNALVGTGKYAEAAGAYARAAKVSNDEKLKADSLRLEAFCLNREGRYADSLAACDSFLSQYRQDPFERDALFLKAENLYFMNKTNEADEIYKQFIPWDGKVKYTDEARFRMAQGAIRNQHYQAALQGLTPLLTENLTDPFFEQLYYLAGFCAFKQERWREAITYFDKFIQMYPDRENADGALLNEAMAHVQLKDFDSAIAQLNKLIANYPDSSHIDNAYMELGKILYDRKEYAKSRAALRHVVSSYKESRFLPFAEYYLGWIAAAEDDNEKAIDHFSNVVKQFPTHKLSADAMFQKAMMQMKKHEYVQAAEELEGYLKKYKQASEQEEALFYYGLALSKQKQNQKAEQVLERFIENYPKSKLRPRALYEMAWISRELKRPTSAADNYTALLKEMPAGELANRATFELAEVEFEQKNYDAAIALLDRLSAQNLPDELKERVLYRMAWSLLGRGQTIPAMETFEMLLERHPQSALIPVAAYQAGEGRLTQKDFEKAYRHFMQSVKTGKNSEIRAQALLRLGETQTLTNRWSDAQKTFTEFLRDYPDSEYKLRAYLWRGWSLENQNKFKEAIEDYRMVLAANRKDEVSARSQFQIGQCYFALKEYDEALKAFVRVELNYNSKVWVPRAMLEVGQVMIKKEMNQEANEQLNKLIKAYPESEEANLARELLVERRVYSVN
jgi:TolA-binding protein